MRWSLRSLGCLLEHSHKLTKIHLHNLGRDWSGGRRGESGNAVLDAKVRTSDFLLRGIGGGDGWTATSGSNIRGGRGRVRRHDGGGNGKRMSIKKPRFFCEWLG